MNSLTPLAKQVSPPMGTSSTKLAPSKASSGPSKTAPASASASLGTRAKVAKSVRKTTVNLEESDDSAAGESPVPPPDPKTVGFQTNDAPPQLERRPHVVDETKSKPKAATSKLRSKAPPSAAKNDAYDSDDDIAYDSASSGNKEKPKELPVSMSAFVGGAKKGASNVLPPKKPIQQQLPQLLQQQQQQPSFFDGRQQRASSGAAPRRASAEPSLTGAPAAPLESDARRRRGAELAAPAAPGAAAQRFVVLRDQHLGSGGFGAVFKGFDTQRGDHVAIKETPIGAPERAATLEQEFALLTALDHPNIVRVFQFRIDHDARTAQIVMEWMSSGSVASVLAQMRFRLHEAVVRRYTRDALRGLAFLHSKGLLHRDIKPANMLVDGGGTVKLSDFGTSRLAEGGAQTTTRTVVGTSAYMAPECIARGKYSQGSDIWGLACGVVEMATNAMPWAHLPDEQLQPIPLMFYIGTAQPPSHHPPLPPALSPPLRALLASMFAHGAAQRPSAAALLAEPYFRDEPPRSGGPRSPSATTGDGAALPDTAESLEEYTRALSECFASAASCSDGQAGSLGTMGYTTSGSGGSTTVGSVRSTNG